MGGEWEKLASKEWKLKLHALIWETKKDESQSDGMILL